MLHHLRHAWDGFVRPMLRRPPRLQVAALCWRMGDAGREILLVTSRGSGRWILPKGWPIQGKDAPGSALQEAWEEAGVSDGEARDEAIGSYTYTKTYDEGWGVPVETLVFPIEVRSLAASFPEAHQRNRMWVSPEEAATLVQEPELKSILRAL